MLDSFIASYGFSASWATSMLSSWSDKSEGSGLGPQPAFAYYFLSFLFHNTQDKIDSPVSGVFLSKNFHRARMSWIACENLLLLLFFISVCVKLTPDISHFQFFFIFFGLLCKWRSLSFLSFTILYLEFFLQIKAGVLLH